MPRLRRQKPVYRPQTVDEDSLMFYLDSLASFNEGGLLYPTYRLIMAMLPRMAGHLGSSEIVKLHSPPPSSQLFTLVKGSIHEFRTQTDQPPDETYALAQLPQRLLELSNAEFGAMLLELDAETLVPLSVIRRQLDSDVLETVHRELAAIPEAVQIAVTVQARQDGSRFLFEVEFVSADIHATAIQARLLRHTLVQSMFPPMSEGADVGIDANATGQVSAD
jgi:hypothetical protein